jgi:glycosyltransferase involved in cell wall biosynthesis
MRLVPRSFFGCHRRAAEPVIWIDLTDLAAWSGSATGIQRVVASFAGPLLQGDGARGFVYHPRQERLVEVVDASAIAIRAAQAAPEAGTAPLSRRRAHRVTHSVCERCHRIYRLTRAYLNSLPATKLTFLRNVRRAASRAYAQFAGDHPPVFRPGDCILVLGMAWTEPAVLDSIATAKNAYGDLRVVVLLYDLVPIMYPHLHAPGSEAAYRSYLSGAAQIADAVISISDATDRDAKRFFADRGVAVPRSTVLRLGDELTSRPASVAPRAHLDEGDYILCVSTFEVRKNHQLLYMTWKLAQERGIALPRLVMAGRIGWITENVRHLFDTDPALREKALMLHNLDDADLMWLYQHCLFTIYPSIYEGWGLPVAEALRLGKVVIASRTSAVQEIAGDLLEYFSPYDPAECLETIVRHLDRRALLDKERAIAELFSPRSWVEAVGELRAFVALVMGSAE